MFRIGEFSRFSRVSVKMLRHYDELQLLKPAWVDPNNGYRYYSAGQLHRLNRIVALKDLGFRLEQIGSMLDEELSIEQIRVMLKLRRAELEQQMRELGVQLAQVETRLGQLERAKTLPPHDVVLRSLAPQLVASIRQSIRVDGETGTALFEELEAYVAQFKGRAPLPPLTVYHDVEFHDQGEDIEVCIPLLKSIPKNDRVTIRELPGCEMMACLIHTGQYGGLAHALSVLLQWVEHNEYMINGPTREVYLRFGADQVAYSLPRAYLTENADEFVTELQIPVLSRKTESEA